MICKNRLCMFENKGTCTFDEGEIDENGHCANCIPISPDMECVKEVKKQYMENFLAHKYKTN